METNIKSHLPAIIIGVVLMIAALLCPFSFFGKDGFNVWLPSIAEYVRGTYKGGGAIFGGQALFGIYGQLPFWLPLKWIGSNPYQILNLTYCVFTFLLYYHSSIIVRGLQSRWDTLTSFVLCVFVILSPVITNRVYAGHFNLLFGILPFLVALTLFYKRSIPTILISLFSLWCAFSIQSYQILSYYLFYVPILWVWMKEESYHDWKKYLLVVSGVTILAFVINVDVFTAMLEHARSLENTRNKIDDIVYSLITFDLSDISGLVFSDYGAFTNTKDFGFFHELNYPIGLAFLSLLFAPKKLQNILLVCFMTILLGCAFASDVPGFNLLAKLPIIKLFRVPHRILILPVFLFTLVALTSIMHQLTGRWVLISLAVIATGNLINPQLLLIPVALVLALAYWKKSEATYGLASAVVFSSLFWGLGIRVYEVIKGNEKFKTYETYVRDMGTHLNLFDEKRIVHFEANDRFPLTIAANYLGIKTLEGYGHPPLSIVQKVMSHQPSSIHPHGNLLFIQDDGVTFKALVKDIGITDVIYINSDGRFKHVETKQL